MKIDQLRGTRTFWVADLHGENRSRAFRTRVDAVFFIEEQAEGWGRHAWRLYQCSAFAEHRQTSAKPSEEP